MEYGNAWADKENKKKKRKDKNKRTEQKWGKKGITLIGLKLKRSWKHTGYQHAAYCPIFAYVPMNVHVHTRVDVCVCSRVCSCVCVFAEAIFEVQCRIQEANFVWSDNPPTHLAAIKACLISLLYSVDVKGLAKHHAAMTLITPNATDPKPQWHTRTQTNTVSFLEQGESPSQRPLTRRGEISVQRKAGRERRRSKSSSNDLTA